MMKLEHEMKFDVIKASHMGMCFGVKAAIKNTKKLASSHPVTVLGELAHNASVKSQLEKLRVKHGSLTDNKALTRNVIITAHGTSDMMRNKWKSLRHQVFDTTCPLVHKAHDTLRNLVTSGYTPLVIGKSTHIEVQGLMGDFPTARAIMTEEDINKLNVPDHGSIKLGVISQTTQQLDHCERIILALRKKFKHAEVRFIDTVCRPTKERQAALLELCSKVTLVIVVGGKNSNNTAQLAQKCRQLGCTSYHIQSPRDIRPEWFQQIDKVGLTAGTSTPEAQIDLIKQRLLEISKS